MVAVEETFQCCSCGEETPVSDKRVRVTISVQMGPGPWRGNASPEFGRMSGMETRNYCSECSKAKDVIEAAKSSPHETLSEMVARMIKKHSL